MPAIAREAALAQTALAEAEAEGVDVSLLRERLRLTPTERVEWHERALAFVEELRAAGVRARGGGTV